MAYRHGAYVSEVQTSVQAAPPVDSALPFVIGSAPVVKGPVLVSSWSQFRDLFEAENVDPDSREYTLCAHAYYWFVLAGRGECIMQSVASPATSGAVVNAIASIHTMYERFGRVASILCAPCASEDAAVAAAMVAAVANIGGRFKGIALLDMPAGYADPEESIDADDLSTHKPTASPFACLCWPYAGVGDYRFAASSVMCAAINATDGTFGGLPYVSPSNKPIPITGAYRVDQESLSRTVPGCYTDADLHVVNKKDPVAATYAGTGGTRYVVQFTLTQTGWTDYSGLLTCHAVVAASGSTYDKTGVVEFESGVGSLDIAAGSSVYSPTVTLGEVWDVGAPISEGVDLPGASAVLGSVPCSVSDGVWLAESAVSDATSLVITYADLFEVPVYMTREDVNTYLGAFGLVGLRNTAAGWVEWGDNTAAYPGNTDVKDYMIPVRRMFNHVGNQFHIFADGRIDMPLNVRQLEGVVKAFNQVLSGWIGFGALNAASVALDAERNTPESLLSGTVYLRVKIAPPPAMVVIEGVIEYDVPGFEASLA